MSQNERSPEQGPGPRSVRHALQQGDYAAAERFWSPRYIQHSAHIAPGREGLFELVKAAPPTLKYEPGLVVAEGDT